MKTQVHTSGTRYPAVLSLEQKRNQPTTATNNPHFVICCRRLSKFHLRFGRVRNQASQVSTNPPMKTMNDHQMRKFKEETELQSVSPVYHICWATGSHGGIVKSNKVNKFTEVTYTGLSLDWLVLRGYLVTNVLPLLGSSWSTRSCCWVSVLFAPQGRVAILHVAHSVTLHLTTPG